MRLGDGQESFNQIVAETGRQNLQCMQDWRDGNNFIMPPPRVAIARRNPFTAFQFSIAADGWLLFCRTIDQKEPRIESSRRKWWRKPATHKNELTAVEL